MTNPVDNNEEGDKKLKEYENDDEKKYNCLRNTWHYFVEYCTNATIHGVRFLGENRTWIETFWWLCSITISLYFCVQLIISAYTKWQNSPVIVSFATRETPAWMVPFPAVTICPEAKVNPRIFNYTNYYLKRKNNESLDDDIERKFGYLSYICHEYYNPFDVDAEKYADEEIIDFYERIQPKFYEQARNCKYLNKSYNCSEIFVPILSDEGICYVFNILDRTELFTDAVIHYKNYHTAPITTDWNLEQGYSKMADVHTYPRRTLFAGVPFALEIELEIDEDEMDSTCGALVEGYKVQIIHPQRLPRVHEQHFILPLDRVSKAAVAPDMTTTSSAVEAYNPKKRNCISPSEQSLQFFKVYSQNNCKIECGALYMFNKCGCVTFYMPRNFSTPICAGGSYACVKEATDDLLYRNIERKIKAYNGLKLGKPDLADCNCLPICTSMYYNVEYSQTPWSRFSVQKQREKYKNRTVHVSKLQVFFKGNQFITLERNELYGSTDFLANVGGLLGLFIGFSALSFIEIIYYLTLRIICNVALFGKQNWSGKIHNSE